MSTLKLTIYAWVGHKLPDWRIPEKETDKKAAEQHFLQ
jgi:hypothetical protein